MNTWKKAHFNETLEEMEIVVLSLPRVTISPINSVAMYNDIEEYAQIVEANEIEGNTKYKTMDKKVKYMAAPL